MSLPFKLGFSRVFSVFARAGQHEDVVFVGAGRLGLPDHALFAFALGCDMVHVGREAMLAVGCIQAQRCHTGQSPTGVATQSKWLMRGLDPDVKSARAANYVRALRGELLALSRTCGVPHPALVTPEMISVVSERYSRETVTDVFGYEHEWSPRGDRAAEIAALIDSTGAAPTPGAESGPVPGDGSGRGGGEGDEAMASPGGGAGGALGGD